MTSSNIASIECAKATEIYKFKHAATFRIPSQNARKILRGEISFALYATRANILLMYIQFRHYNNIHSAKATIFLCLRRGFLDDRERERDEKSYTHNFVCFLLFRLCLGLEIFQ